MIRRVIPAAEVDAAVFAALPHRPANGLGSTKFQLAAVTGFDSDRVYRSLTRLRRNPDLQDANGNRLYFCREQIGGRVDHLYFFTVDQVLQRQHGWYRDKYNKTTAATTEMIKTGAVEIGGELRDAESLALAAHAVEVQRMAVLFSRVNRPTEALEFRYILPFLEASTVQLKELSDRMETLRL